MKKYPGIKISFALLLLTTACGNEKINDTDNATTATVIEDKPQIIFDKLVGTWKDAEGKFFERWTKNADGSYSSVAFSVKGSDTTNTEQIHVYRENGKWISANTVTDQNEGKAVKFTESMINENSVQFSNPAHNFPTDINYTMPDANTVNAFIGGPNKQGGKDTIPFNYTRVN